jgi:hypothetical protein
MPDVCVYLELHSADLTLLHCSRLKSLCVSLRCNKRITISMVQDFSLEIDGCLSGEEIRHFLLNTGIYPKLFESISCPHTLFKIHFNIILTPNRMA